MRPLIDGDILVYEVGFIGDTEDGPAQWDFVAEVLDGRIRDICEEVGATKPPVLYLTGSTNFREEIAVSRPYKGTRKDAKPYHFQNIKAYMHNQYDVRLTEGLEADDLMSIEQTRSNEEYFYSYEHPEVVMGVMPTRTIICTRDKDLRMVPGWHYGWECGAQFAFGPQLVDGYGKIWMDTSKKQPKLRGVGMLFFYVQLLMGDAVDNIPGVPLVGPKKAYTILTEENGRTPYEKVKAVYESKNLTQEYLMEQANLLWMVRELNEDGSPVLWKPPS